MNRAPARRGHDRQAEPRRRQGDERVRDALPHRDPCSRSGRLPPIKPPCRREADADRGQSMSWGRRGRRTSGGRAQGEQLRHQPRGRADRGREGEQGGPRVIRAQALLEARGSARSDQLDARDDGGRQHDDLEDTSEARPASVNRPSATPGDSRSRTGPPGRIQYIARLSVTCARNAPCRPSTRATSRPRSRSARRPQHATV